MADALPLLSFPDAGAWDAWLAGQHAASPGAWLRIARKGAPEPTVSYADALTVALCHGWIDGQKGRLDESYWRQRFTPRRPGSRWSKINADKAAALIEAGLMKPAGLREVEAARADGRWDSAYASQSRATVPEDLALALAADERAGAFFAALDSANRYAILYRIAEAKRPDTRARRIATFVAMLHEHQKIHP
ncbi:MAG: YdeI/OmpD-associated family protein [Gemmatimonadota bacterium]